MTELSELSTEELKQMLQECETKISLADKSQHSTKILLNSLYGAMGTPYFRMYDIHMAEGITLSGQATVSQSYTMFNDYLNDKLKTKNDYVIASDTDSAYINLTAFVNSVIPNKVDHSKKVDAVVKICDEMFSGMLDKTFSRFAEETNAWSNAIDMKREAVASACFVAKKNYVMYVYDNEGTRYATPKQKITGLEAIKSSTPEYFREKLKEGYSFVFNKTEADVQKFVADVHAEYMSLPTDRIAGTTSVSELVKYMDGDGYTSGTPSHVRGALAYNRLLKEHNLTEKYSLIKPGDKVKIVPLKKQNPIRENFFCYLDNFPVEIMKPQFIDREGNYQKYFVAPLMRVLDVVKWNHEYVASLDDLFG